MFARFSSLLARSGSARAATSCGVAAATIFGAGLTCISADTNVKETVTSFPYPVKREAGPARHDVLKGIGMRCMLGRCEISVARAYAVGLYVKEGSGDFKQAELSWKGIESTADERMQPDQAMLEKIVEEGKDMSLVLVMARPVNGKHIGRGFDRSLVHRVRKLYNGERQNPGKEALRDFASIFTFIPQFEVDDKIIFTWEGKSTLHVRVERVGKPAVVHTIESESLCTALKDTYLGKESVFGKYKATSFKMPSAEV